MKTLDIGHYYELPSLDGGEPQRLAFVKRVGDKYPCNATPYPGTTSQEVLRALVDRANYVNWQLPCWQTRLSIRLMRICIWLYEQRAAKKHHRKAPSFFAATYGSTCVGCGHVGCEGKCIALK